MDIRDFPKVLIFICTLAIAESAGTVKDVKLLETPTVVGDGNSNSDGAPNYDITDPSQKDANYKLSYADYATTWRNFKRVNNKRYASTIEERRRFAIFMENVKNIEAQNMKYHLGQSAYWMNINSFSDWTQEEFDAWLPPLPDETSRSKREADNSFEYDGTGDADVSDSVDWRKNGFNLRMKNQGNCGSCYAFSTTSSIEAQWFTQDSKTPIDLSEQQIVDCSNTTLYQNRRCNGGTVEKSYRYIISEGGLQADSEYRYTGNATQECKFIKSRAVAMINRYYKVKSDEEVLKRAVGKHGPVAVGMYVTDVFLNTSIAGDVIFKDTEGCENEKKKVKPRRHAMLVVGYGRSSGREDYWIVRNCWGSGFRDKGYIYMARNTGGLGICDIAARAVFPGPVNVNLTILNNASTFHQCLENNSIFVFVTSMLVFLKFIELFV